MPRKNKIFSGKKYNPRGSFKRAEKKLAKGIFSVPDITMLSLEDIRDLKAFIKSRKKKIKYSNDYPGEIAKRYNLVDIELKDDPIELLEIFNAQEMYFEQAMIEQEINETHEFDIMTKDDKWLIIRRLATEDFMLNLDRAYASETLKTIERLIEENKKTMTYQELADALLNGEFEEYKFDRANPEAGLKPFKKSYSYDTEEQALAANRGFHGVDKAMAKLRRDLSQWAAVWEEPGDIQLIGEEVIKK